MNRGEEFSFKDTDDCRKKLTIADSETYFENLPKYDHNMVTNCHLTFKRWLNWDTKMLSQGLKKIIQPLMKYLWKSVLDINVHPEETENLIQV